MDTTRHNGDLKIIVTSDIVDPKIRKSSQIGLNQPFESQVQKQTILLELILEIQFLLHYVTTPAHIEAYLLEQLLMMVLYSPCMLMICLL